ncbi:hypothetical protein [uncultured Roseobacter sp.]|uniref:hypothetical protein n=1 Tax=uncultured Roseobacter sp. TaxID=114847 RepID=UPI0026228774|nr:hypothetical protein [uncultured Roseobacter sp.]
MPDGRTEDAERLCKVLSSLRNIEHGFSARGRPLAKEDAAQRLRAILQEIDETVLRRHLRFTNDRVGDLVLDVAERRLFGVSVGKDVRLEKGDGIAETQISIDDPASVAGVLQGFCAEADSVYVQTEIAQSALPEGVMGLSAADLSAQLFEGSGKAMPSVTLETAIADCRIFALAIFDSDAAEGAAIIGQTALGMELQALDTEHGSGKVIDEQSSPDHCVIWARADAQMPAILKVHHNGRHLWVAFEADQLDACIECWSAIFA